MLISSNYNPDVLNCLANLSSDEVFTPPKLVNEILDLLPQELFADENTTFLDPVCKTGVFLREIAKRLDAGLEKKIPNQQKRIDHIFSKQLYGIAITDLTALLSRRSLYCSKSANGKYSVCESFDDQHGNIRFERIEHTWKNGRCLFCGANQKNYARGDDLETHAYEFIHSEDPQEMFKMKFDVIIGNPPYQLNDGGGTGSSAKPIYNLFVDQSKKLNPRFLSMIIPARWYSGGKGLDDFRNVMMNDNRIRNLVDFEDSRDCFPEVDIAGGICYFLWNRDDPGICEVKTFRKNDSDISHRYLNEFEYFIRDNIAINILHKIISKHSSFLNEIVSSRMPFGLTSNVEPDKDGDLVLIKSDGNSKISYSKITNGEDLVMKWKVLLSKTSHDHAGQPDKEGKRRIFSRIDIMPPSTVCSETYLVIGNYENEEEAVNMVEYLKTKFCRFLVSTILLTQNITKGKFIFVPNLDMKKLWSDEILFNKYGLSNNEIEYIKSKIRPME
jgi:site-specific DNA-methyltransferase (adenine-specific)